MTVNRLLFQCSSILEFYPEGETNLFLENNFSDNIYRIQMPTYAVGCFLARIQQLFIKEYDNVLRVRIDTTFQA